MVSIVRQKYLDYLETYLVTEPELITMDEIEVLISALPLRKAAGHNNLTNEHLKFAPPPSHRHSHRNLERFLLSGHIPTSFRKGVIIPVPKGI